MAVSPDVTRTIETALIRNHAINATLAKCVSYELEVENATFAEIAVRESFTGAAVTVIPEPVPACSTYAMKNAHIGSTKRTLSRGHMSCCDRM